MFLSCEYINALWVSCALLVYAIAWVASNTACPLWCLSSVRRIYYYLYRSSRDRSTHERTLFLYKLVQLKRSDTLLVKLLDPTMPTCSPRVLYSGYPGRLRCAVWCGEVVALLAVCSCARVLLRPLPYFAVYTHSSRPVCSGAGWR